MVVCMCARCSLLVDIAIFDESFQVEQSSEHDDIEDVAAFFAAEQRKMQTEARPDTQPAHVNANTAVWPVQRYGALRRQQSSETREQTRPGTQAQQPIEPPRYRFIECTCAINRACFSLAL